MQTRGPWGFKTPAIPGFRSAANLARASYGFTPPLTRFYSRAGRQTFSAPFRQIFLRFIRVQRCKRSEVEEFDRGAGYDGIWIDWNLIWISVAIYPIDRYFSYIF